MALINASVSYKRGKDNDRNQGHFVHQFRPCDAQHHESAFPETPLQRRNCVCSGLVPPNTASPNCLVLYLQAAAAAFSLQLASLCDALRLPAAASDWRKLAAVERWPSQEQLQQAEQQAAVAGVVDTVLLHHAQPVSAGGGADVILPADQQTTVQAANNGGNTGSNGGGCSETVLAATPSFLVEALNQAGPVTVKHWVAENCNGNVGGGRMKGGNSGLKRPASAAGAGAAAITAAGGTSESTAALLAAGVMQVKPMGLFECWLYMAQYLVDHAQYTAGQQLCSVAFSLAK